ncbi:MAG: 50S ribosomal protein L4 [Bacteroidales bacterium]|nr:50S ribosomal protein L4 [Bacteroidales bacterium]
MELIVYNTAGEETGRKVKLSDSVFGIEPNDHAIYLDVKQHLANRRQGTHKTRERSEISGSTRKIKRQKGTGTARAGSIKNPLFVGGGRIFGPQPRDYHFKLNKKVKQLARKSALTYKAKDNQIVVVEDFVMKEIRTKEYISIISNLKVDGEKSLLVVNEPDKNIYLSARNLNQAKVVTCSELSTYDIMNSASIVFMESSVDNIQKIL